MKRSVACSRQRATPWNSGREICAAGRENNFRRKFQLSMKKWLYTEDMESHVSAVARRSNASAMPPMKPIIARGAKREENWADRSLSRLLREDWPRTLEDME